MPCNGHRHYEDRQRPRTIYLRDRPQWQELLPHLRQLGIEVVLTDDLPRFDEAVIEWMQKTTKPNTTDEIKAALRKPFPERKRNLFTDDNGPDGMDGCDVQGGLSVPQGSRPGSTIR